MPLWHDVCSYPWKSCQFWCEYRAPDPTHTHILDAHLQNHWTTLGVRCYTTQSPGWSLCINNIYIYMCVWIYILIWLYRYIYIYIIWPFNLVYTHLSTDALHACSRNGVPLTSQVRPPLATWRRIPAATQWRFWGPGSCSWSNNTYISITHRIHVWHIY